MMIGSICAMKTRKLFALILLASSAGACAFSDRTEFTTEDNFSENSVRRGIRATQAQCQHGGKGFLWVVVNESLKECIKYWSAGLSTTTRRAVVFLHGDIFPTSDFHLKLTDNKLRDSAARWHEIIGAPYVYIGRPGTHGSSGDHNRRRTFEEVQIISKAIDLLKVNHGIQELVLAGQSGGGHAVSSLLTVRNDIVCAIPASAINSPRVRYLRLGRSRDVTNLESYEPIEHLKSNAMHEKLRVFILGDPDDSNVFWESQTALKEPLVARGVDVNVIEGVATGKSRHALNDSARHLAGLCYHDRSTDVILNYLRSRGIKG